MRIWMKPYQPKFKEKPEAETEKGITNEVKKSEPGAKNNPWGDATLGD